MLNVKKGKLLKVLAPVMLAASLAVALGGCAPKAGDDQGAAEATYPTGSLKAVHVEGQLDGVESFDNKVCLSCHTRDTINAANENYRGIEGFNPHKAHLAAGDCVTCHSVDGTSTMTCNECHDAPLPEGWQSAERGSGPLHSLTKK